MNERGQAGVRPRLRIRAWSRRVHLARWLAFGLGAAAVASGVATVATMTAKSSDVRQVINILYLDIGVLFLLAAVVAWRLVELWRERRRGIAGSRLHAKLSALFGLIAVAPALLVAVFSAIFLNFGLQAWFSERVKRAVEESAVVANSYLQEHRQNIRADIFAMANDLNRDAPNLIRSPQRMNQTLSAQAALRSLNEAMIVDSSGRVFARSEFSLSLEFDLVPQGALEVARGGDIAVLTSESDDRVRAAIRLNRFVDAYLIVGRFVDARVVDHIQRIEKGVAQYRRMEQERAGVQVTFVAMFVVVALLLLLAAAWIGQNVASQLARPIGALIAAAERIAKGDLTVRVEEVAREHELSTLSRAFNRMVGQIASQREGLVAANRQLDERRRFTETVLAGVSAGVIGLDGQGRIHLPNRSASELLDADLGAETGRPLAEVVPEMAGLLEETMKRPDRLRQAEIRVARKGRSKTFLAGVAAERIDNEIVGFVVTFDDITELQSAQRKAAWADVARRIAHEVKNPLTPIRLAAERLKRRYVKEIANDPETFAACTETIIRQVEDIGRLIDEFSSFARMPQPSMKAENLSQICREAVFLERNRHPAIEYRLRLPNEDVRFVCDGRQIGRALTNLLKNAAESIAAKGLDRADAAERGWIGLSLAEPALPDGAAVALVVEDNGQGLPGEIRDRLTEPYVTTRTRGTGLGLAIVKKIVEDHHGDLAIDDREGGGAKVTIVFRAAAAGAETAEEGKDAAAGAAEDPMQVATGIRA
jgi:two-component system nitrogen regulation sensor histidine kinase NtrY